MAAYHLDLLTASRRLLRRRRGQRGPLAGAFIRRSISTTYYALFHFLIDRSGSSALGSTSPLIRRRSLSRSFTHAGMRMAMSRLRGRSVDVTVAGLFRPAGTGSTPMPVPTFVQDIAKAFIDAQAKREDADYNLAERLSEADARDMRRRVRDAIGAWDAATSAADRDFKHSVSVLLLMKGSLRPGRD